MDILKGERFLNSTGLRQCIHERFWQEIRFWQALAAKPNIAAKMFLFGFLVPKWLDLLLLFWCRIGGVVFCSDLSLFSVET